jgi:hypothetical protein
MNGMNERMRVEGPDRRARAWGSSGFGAPHPPGTTTTTSCPTLTCRRRRLRSKLLQIINRIISSSGHTRLSVVFQSFE